MINPRLFLALLIAVAGFAGGWQVQAWRYAVKENERAKQDLAQLQANTAATIRRLDNTITAQNSARIRSAGLRRDLDAAYSELDRLRVLLQAPTPTGTSDAPGTCRTPAASELLLECAKRYTELAGKADRHVDDVKTLIEAWPK